MNKPIMTQKDVNIDKSIETLRDAFNRILHERDLAINMLATWSLAVDEDSSWDGWREYYKTVTNGDGPLRKLIDDEKKRLTNQMRLL